MFGNDKKGNYGPLSLNDYSDDSDDENDFVSEQIRNQRVSGWTGLFCEACWSLTKSGMVPFVVGRGVLDSGLCHCQTSTEERRSKIKSYVGFRIVQTVAEKYYVILGHHRLTAITSDVILEVSYPCVASQKRRF